MIRTRIAGLGRHVPERILTNADLERMVETSDEWIINRTGIRERRIAAPHETTSTLATAAARRALADANIAAEDLDLVICATTTPDGLFPSVASLVQEAVGARRAGAFDINAACMGFLSALATASQFIAAGSAQRVLVVGAETLSRIVDWTDRSTCVLFGDGAGALVLEAAERGGPLGFVLHSDGGKRDALYAEGPCGARDDEDKGPLECFIRMDGPAIFKFAVHAMTEAVRETLATARVGADEIDVLVPHQANLRIIQGAAKALGIPPEKAVVNIERYGNTSSASIPMALCEASEHGRLAEGARVMLCGFGGGLAWGAMLLEWSRTGVPAPAPGAANPVRV
ncbi:MAG TPA: beta-ketoacyl-ACP synthase III [Dehalococcoidia bacterium]|nr:beta-ketoacyl-ACP synthase III [Dehalococcoidia bacterium]